MAAIIRDSFKVRTLKQFIAGLATDSLYLGIARPQLWDEVGLDATVPAPINNPIGILQDWEDMTAMKRIISTDVSHGIFKETWQPNIKYDTYRHDWDGTRASVYNGANAYSTLPTSIGDVKCVVVTSNYQVYICLKQNIVLGEVQASLYSPDTGTPIGTNTGIVKTSDGYYWKLISVTSAGDIIKFSSKYYHPIKTLDSAPGGADPYYPQWTAQQNSIALKGGIYVVNVSSKGSGYNGGSSGTRAVTAPETDAEFKVIGDGTGLLYTVTYGATGTIEDVEVTNPGTGYTYATITATTGVGAIFDIIFTPSKGLGTDPIYDVVARFLIASTKLEGAEGSGDFTVTNEFRKILLIYNPINYGSSAISTAATLDATLSLNVQTGLSSGAYPVDAIITGATSGCKAIVVDFTSSTGAIRVIRTSRENLGSIYANNDFQVGETINSSPGTGTGIVASIATPEVQPKSGEIIYSEYRAPVLRNISQSESLSVIVKF